MEEYIPPGDFPVLIFLGKEVRVEPKVIAMLKSVQVPYLEVLRPGETMMGQMGTVDTHGRIAVPRDNYFDVIDLLRRQALGEPPPVCNETVRADWQCAGCGEENPGNFDICWNCGHEAP